MRGPAAASAVPKISFDHRILRLGSLAVLVILWVTLDFMEIGKSTSPATRSAPRQQVDHGKIEDGFRDGDAINATKKSGRGGRPGHADVAAASWMRSHRADPGASEPFDLRRYLSQWDALDAVMWRGTSWKREVGLWLEEFGQSEEVEIDEVLRHDTHC